MLGRWRELGEKRVLDEAHRLVQQALSNYDYELAPEKSRALDGLYDRALEALA
jgi:hypothetical protein